MTGEASPEPGKGWWTDHLSLLITTSIFVLVVIRVRVVSDSLPTSLEVLRHVASVQVGMALLLFVVESVGPYLTYMALRQQRRTNTWFSAWMVVTPAAYIMFTVVPWFLALASAVAIVAGMTARKRWPPKEGLGLPKSRTPLGSDLALLGLLAVVFTTPVIFGRQMWLPAERVTIASGDEVVAYVLSNEDGGFTTVLVESSRAILKIKTDDINARDQCVTSTPTRTFFELLRGESSHAPPCPKD